jgi:hypothetical protein
MWANTSSGLIHQAKTGSTYDYQLINPAASVAILSVNAGTVNLLTGGNLTVAGALSATGVIYGNQQLRLQGATSNDIQSYTGSAYVALNYDALSHRFQVSGSEKGLFSSTGLAVTGALSSSGSATIQGMTVGLGGSAVSVNTAIGVSALAANTTGDNNLAVGRRAGLVNTTGTTNTFIGVDTGISCTTGSRNTLLGAGAGGGITTGSRNTFVGTSNGVDGSSGGFVTTGSANSILGNYTGNQGGLDIRTSSNNIVLSDGDGNPRLIINSSGNVGIGTTSPARKLHVYGTGTIATLESSNTGLYLELKNSGGSAYIGSLSGSNMYFETGGTERARIDSSGNLLVGTTSVSPSSGVGVKLAYDPTAPYVAVTGTGTYFYAFNDSASAYRFYVTPAGQINATSTSINAISDVSLKENIRDLETGLAEILALKPRRFDWKAETHINEKNVAGFIAQEVEGILPELVYDFEYNKDSTKKSLKMGDMLPTVIKALQELNANLVAQVAALSQRLAALESN